VDNVPGTIYLLHFDRPYKHARHYLGWARDLDARLADHDAGRGARLTAVVIATGIGWTLARTWPGTRTRERQIKKQGGASRCCPECGVRPRPGGSMTDRDPGGHQLRAGHQAAERSIAAQAHASADAGTTARHQDDAIAQPASEADTPQARALAGAVADDPRGLSRAQPRMEPGTPHPDSRLAARGWEVGPHGIYTRTGRRQPGRQLEAG
jgi:predicted GIY-YIG superfamily endonuclease